jgi:hypothetical protein
VAWYDDRSRTDFVGSYANSKQFQRDLQMAARRGWFVQGNEPGPSAGTTSASNTKITVTFLRSPDWLANREREIADDLVSGAAKVADDKEARLVGAQEALERAERVFASRRPTDLTADGPGWVQAERELLGALEGMISKRRLVLRALDETVKEMATAVALGASDFAPTLSRYQRARESGIARLESELHLLRGQELVARSAKEWLGASDRQRAAEAELRKRTTELEVREADLAFKVKARDDALEALTPSES